MKAKEETTKVPEYKEWAAVLDKLKGLVNVLEDGDFKESSKLQIDLIREAVNRIAEEPIPYR